MNAWIKSLASKPIQMRYIVNADTDEYLLPDEMLDMALSFCDRAAPNTKEQDRAIRGLAAAIRDSGDFLASYDRSNIAGLIENDPRWLAIRQAAVELLRAYRVPIPDDLD